MNYFGNNERKTNMKKTTRLTAILLAVIMLMQTFSFAAKVSDFEDFPRDWSTEAMTDAVNNGLLVGTSKTTIEPKKNLTRAEMTAIISRAFGATVPMDISFTRDVKASDWFYNSVALSYQMGVFNGTRDDMFEPNEFIRREDVFLGLSRVLVISDDDHSVLDKYTDKGQVDSWAISAVSGMVKIGYLKGYENNTLRPRGYITRAELAQIFHNIIRTYISEPGTYDKVAENGSVLIRSKDVTLENVTVNGDLILADGIGNGNCNITNVHVTGRILVRGGEGTVTFKNVTADGKVIINDPNGTVNFHNYRTDVPFKNNLEEITPATFLTNQPDTKPGGNTGGGGGGGVVTRRYNYKTEFYLEDLDGNYVLDDSLTKTAQGKYNEIVSAKELTAEESVGFSENTTHAGRITVGTIKNGYLVLKRYYSRNEYSVKFIDTDATTQLGETQNYKYEASIPESAIPTPSAAPEGKKIVWCFDKEGTEPVDFASFKMPAANVTIYAVLVDIDKAAYKTEYYFEDLDGNYVIDSALTVSGLDYIGKEVTAPGLLPIPEGFVENDTHADRVVSGNIAEDGSLTLKRYYKRIEYTVKFLDKDGAEITAFTETVKYGGKIANTDRTTAAPAGQKFEGWSLDGTNKIDLASLTITADITLKPVFVEADKYEYKTEIYTENLDGTYSLKTTISGYDYDGTAVTAKTYTETGFEEDTAHPDRIVNGTVDKNNVIVLARYYKRIEYTVKFLDKDGAEIAAFTETVKYGGKIANTGRTTAAPDGKKFIGWSLDGVNKVELADITVTANVTLKPLFETAAKYAYVINYYFENLDDDDFTADDTLKITGTDYADETVTAAELDAADVPEGFEFDSENSVMSGTVRTDGSLELKVYYKRVRPDVKFFDSDRTTQVGATLNPKYGSKITPPAAPAAEKGGKPFCGWSTDGTLAKVVDFNLYTVGAAAENFYAVYDNSTIQYEVIFTVHGDQYGPTTKVYGGGYATQPADPVVEGEIFKGWSIDGTNVIDVASYAINTDTEFKAVMETILVRVEFYDPSKSEAEKLVKTMNVKVGSTLAESDFPTEVAPWSVNGFYKDGTLSSYYVGKEYQHVINYRWLFEDETTGDWTQFVVDSTKVDSSADPKVFKLYYTSKMAHLEVDTPRFTLNFMLSAPYEDDSRVIDTIKDALFINESYIKTVYDSKVDGKFEDKLAERGLIDPATKEILNVNRMVKFVTVLGEANLNKFLDDRLEINANLDDDTLLQKYGKIYLRSATDAQLLTICTDKYETICAEYGLTLFESKVLPTLDSMQQLAYESLSDSEKAAYVNNYLIANKSDILANYSDDLVSYTHDYINGLTDAEIDELINQYRENIKTEFADQIAQEKEDYKNKIEDQLVILKDQLAHDEQFDVNKDNLIIVSALRDFVDESDYDSMIAKYLTRVPQSLIDNLPNDIIRPIYERTRTRYLNEIDAAMALINADSSATTTLDSGVTLQFNPVSEVYIPMQAYAIDKYDRLGDEINNRNPEFYGKYNKYVEQNPYVDPLLELTNAENWFNGSAKPYTAVGSGYTLKEFDDYYNMVKASSVLLDDMFVWYCRNVSSEDLNKVLDKSEERVLHYVNYALDLLNLYNTNGIPTSLKDLVDDIMKDDMIKNDIIKAGQKVTDKDIEDYIDKLARNKVADGAYDKLSVKFAARIEVILEKFASSKFNRTYTEEDYAKAKKAINIIHANDNKDVTVDYTFDKVVKGDSKSYEYKNNTVTVWRDLDNG